MFSVVNCRAVSFLVSVMCVEPSGSFDGEVGDVMCVEPSGSFDGEVGDVGGGRGLLRRESGHYGIMVLIPYLRVSSTTFIQSASDNCNKQL